MNIAPLLFAALQELNNKMKHCLDQTQLNQVSETINYYALASAAASVGVAMLPAGGALAAAAAQTGFVWATYVKINKALRISMSEEIVKFLGTAMVTNLITSYGVVMVGHILAGVVSCIPLIGGIAAGAAEAVFGYVLIYACSILYLKLITKLVKPDGSIAFTSKPNTETTIKELMKDTSVRDIFKEAKTQFSSARENGSFEKVRKSRFCPKCGTEYTAGDHFCSSCGHDLTK